MKFTKMHGLGNDFIIFDNRAGEKLDFYKISKKLCRRRLSIGADGLLVVENSDIADLKMRIFNPDGTEAEMCGNGIRCFALWAYKRKLVDSKSLNVETLAGIIKPALVDDPQNPAEFLVRVNMGKPIFSNTRGSGGTTDISSTVDETIIVEGKKITYTPVSLGNPHCVIFTDVIDDSVVSQFGPSIEKHPNFPNRTNVEFVKIISPDHVRVRVWERGAGLTLACGTGACASAAAGVKKGLLAEDVRVTLPGGELIISWNGKDSIFMTGPAMESFIGEVKI